MTATTGQRTDVYVRLSDLPVHHTHQGAVVNVDYAADGSPVGVEVLDACAVEVNGRQVRLAVPPCGLTVQLGIGPALTCVEDADHGRVHRDASGATFVELDGIVDVRP